MRYRSLSFASCHYGNVKIVCCISQVNFNISVSIFCEQIRKVARCSTSYCYIRNRSCFTFHQVGDSKSFKVLDQKGSRCIVSRYFWILRVALLTSDHFSFRKEEACSTVGIHCRASCIG